MESYSYKTILARARTMKKSVESEQKVGVNVKWSYYFAQSILNPKKDIEIQKRILKKLEVLLKLQNLLEIILVIKFTKKIILMFVKNL